mgnify:CR=1 FL=1
MLNFLATLIVLYLAFWIGVHAVIAFLGWLEPRVAKKPRH